MSRVADFYITQSESVERVASNLKINSDPSVFEPEALVLSIRASIATLQLILANLDPENEIQFQCGECNSGKEYTLDEGRSSVRSNGVVEFYCWDHE